MKKYRVETEILSGFNKGETVVAVDFEGAGFPSLPKEHNGIDEKIVERNPEWFSPVEEEFQEGDWVVNKNYDGGIFRVEEVEEGRIISHTEQRRALATDYRPATKKEIEEHLIAEAKRRGYKPGMKVKRGPHFSPNSASTKLSDGFIPEYFPEEDSLDFCGARIYKEGTWASIIDEPIQINGYEVEIDNRLIKIGCSVIHTEDFMVLKNFVYDYDLSIYREGENITKQIKQIADKL